MNHYAGKATDPVRFMVTRFIPHGHCYLWQPDLVLLHVLSDSLIATAYFSIPLLLIYFIRQRRDVPFRKIFILFSAFIISCGLTHVMEIWTLWVPAYWISGAIKVMTAAVSLYTAFVLIPVIPQALSLPSPAELALLNQTLSAEIQERKQAQQEIQTLNEKLQKQVQELEQLAILKDEFMSTISHELRTPLTSMKMAITMLKLQRDPGKQSIYLEILEREWQRELKLVNQLLELQALDAGSKTYSIEKVDLTDWIPKLLLPFRWRCDRGQGADLHLYLPEVPVSVFTDPALLEQVILELLNNACKYTPVGHSISLTCESTPGGCRIMITNTGVTIPTEDQERIFEKFYRNASLDHFNQGGTGLGLTIVRKTLEILKGTIQLHSADDITTFTLEIPHLGQPT